MLKTDEFISAISQQANAYAVKSKIYGIDIYVTYEDFRDDDREVNWIMTVDPKATNMAQPFGENYIQDRWLEELTEEQQGQITDLIEEYINTPVEARGTYVDRDDMEGIRKRLMGYFSDHTYGEKYRNGRLDAARGLLSDLRLEKVFNEADTSYKLKQLKAVNE